MSWIGSINQNVMAFNPCGIGSKPHSPCTAQKDGILPVGTLMIEAIFVAQSRKPQRLLRYEFTDGWLRHLSLVLSSEGDLLLEMRQGDAVSSARLNISAPPRETRLRITYSWDAPERRAILTVENLDQELLHQTEFSSPLPMPLTDAEAIICNRPATRIGPETRYVAISDQIEPVGLTPGVVKGTPVETPWGPKLIERLRLGDMVVTSEGVEKPVRWIIRREVPALGRFIPVRLRAPYFGLTRDILVAPNHRLMVTGPEAEYLFGEGRVLVEAMYLVDEKAARRERSENVTQWYYHILLDGHECLNYAGLWGESLFVGAIGRMPEMISTTALAEMPASAMPRHTRFALPVLSGLEARSLVYALSA